MAKLSEQQLFQNGVKYAKARWENLSEQDKFKQLVYFLLTNELTVERSNLRVLIEIMRVVSNPLRKKDLIFLNGVSTGFHELLDSYKQVLVSKIKSCDRKYA